MITQKEIALDKQTAITMIEEGYRKMHGNTIHHDYLVKKEIINHIKKFYDEKSKRLRMTKAALKIYNSGHE